MGNKIKGMRLLALVAFIGLAGCAAHNPPISKDAANAPIKEAGNTNKVIFLEKGLPEDVEFDILGEVAANKVWYGGMDVVLDKMANDARALKADAVIYVNTWYSPAGMAWPGRHHMLTELQSELSTRMQSI